jgi:hypothetical protein
MNAFRLRLVLNTYRNSRGNHMVHVGVIARVSTVPAQGKHATISNPNGSHGFLKKIMNPSYEKRLIICYIYIYIYNGDVMRFL